jgi:hypothetical protein
LIRNEERGATPAQHPRARRTIIGDDVERREFFDLAAQTQNHLFPGAALKSGEKEGATPVAPQYELQHTVAEPADAVIEHQVSPQRLLPHLRHGFTR